MTDFEKIHSFESQGFDTYIVQIGKYYKVQVGAFSVKKNAEAMLEKLKKAGHDDAFITYSGTSGGTSARKITTGSKVRVKAAEALLPSSIPAITSSKSFPESAP